MAVITPALAHVSCGSQWEGFADILGAIFIAIISFIHTQLKRLKQEGF